MPRKRRQPKAHARVTAAAVEAYRRGDWHSLHMHLGLRPWHESPLGVDGPTPPSYCDAALWAESWRLRCELEAALAGDG